LFLDKYNRKKKDLTLIYSPMKISHCNLTQEINQTSCTVSQYCFFLCYEKQIVTWLLILPVLSWFPSLTMIVVVVLVVIVVVVVVLVVDILFFSLLRKRAISLFPIDNTFFYRSTALPLLLGFPLWRHVWSNSNGTRFSLSPRFSFLFFYLTFSNWRLLLLAAWDI
jgi:hypothetical protein